MPSYQKPFWGHASRAAKPRRAVRQRLSTAHRSALAKIETIYGSVFEGILGERVSTKPVEVVTPFSWRAGLQAKR